MEGEGPYVRSQETWVPGLPLPSTCFFFLELPHPLWAHSTFLSTLLCMRSSLSYTNTWSGLNTKMTLKEVKPPSRQSVSQRGFELRLCNTGRSSLMSLRPLSGPQFPLLIGEGIELGNPSQPR